MKKVQLRNVSHEEMEAKKIVLEASGVFPTKFLQILNRGGMNGLELELSDEQCQVLKALNLVEKEGDIEEPREDGINQGENSYSRIMEEETNDSRTPIASKSMEQQSRLEQNREEAESLKGKVQKRTTKRKRR